MRIHLYTLPLLIISGLCNQAAGQGRYTRGVYLEAGTGVNLPFFDVGGGSPGLSIQGGVLYDLTPHWRLGATIGTHRARGTDKGTPNASRGYEFRSNLKELSARGVYVFRFKTYPMKRWKNKMEPRAYASAGILQYQPKPNQMLASLANGENLTVSPFFSAGLGLSCRFNQDLTLLLEGGGNLATSDYLESYPDPDSFPVSDLYFTLLVKFIYKVPRHWQ